MTVNAEIEHDPLVVIVVELRFRSQPDVPTLISMTRRPVDLQIAAHAAVPPAHVASAVIVFAVMTPAAAAPKAFVDGNASDATTVFAAVVAADVSAGCTPA